jgi:hypothetical protein
MSRPRPRRPGQPLSFRSATVLVFDPHFPRSVAGEEYQRFARAMWRHAQHWMNRQWPRVTGPGASMHDAREALRTIATVELDRRLRLQEERLLSEVLFEMWTTRERDVPDILPFWSRASPLSPHPAA